jgi:hypothetical protein
LGGTVAKELPALRMRKSMGGRDASAEEEDNGEAKSRTRARCAVKKG